MKPSPRVMLLSGAVALLAGSAVLSDEAGETEPAAPIRNVPVDLAPGETAAVHGGRVTTLLPTAPDLAGIRIVEQPGHGHVSVNPDTTLALVLTGTDHAGALSFRYEITGPDGETTRHTAALDVIPSPQESSWGTSVNHYMLPVDEVGRVVVEHGADHRKVYVSGNGLTAADIAAGQWDVAEDDVTSHWLGKNPQYGASEDMALAPDLGFALWSRINPRGSDNSNWLLLERGHAYSVGLIPREVDGESALHPLFIGAWGTGEKPEIVEDQQSNHPARHMVLQDIHFSKRLTLLGTKENILIDNAEASGEVGIQGRGKGGHTAITLRNTLIRDAWHTRPNSKEDGRWSAHKNRASGLYTTKVDGFLFDGVIFDHNGFAPDFSLDASVENGHPPSMFSHNLYAQGSVLDATLRDSILMRGASFGAQFRGGAYVTDTVFLDNNIPLNVLGGNYKDRGPVGQYSLLDGNLVTSAAWRGRDRETGQRVPKIGAVNWGIRNSALLTTLVDNLVVHANDPDDEADTRSGKSALRHVTDPEHVFANDTVIWRWGWGEEGASSDNIDGRDPDRMNDTTIERYTADLLGKETGGIDDLARHLRSLDSADYAAASRDILTYFRAGFGIDRAARDTAATLRFVPDMRGDGVRWDNRLNWDSGDLPGSVAGDSVDLGGNRVVFGGDVTLDDLTFGPDGGLLLTHGRLQLTDTISAGPGATVEIDRAGQLWATDTTGDAPLTLAVTGGRFVNAGTFGSPVRLTATGGQTLLGTGGSEFRVDAQSHVHVDGPSARIGFDGDGDEAALVRIDPGATFEFTATSDGVSTIGEFRSGAFGEVPAVQSGMDLGGAALTVNLTDPTSLDALILVDVDEIMGRFEDVTVQGLGDRDASLVTNYESDMVSLQLSSGTGQVSVSEIGTPDTIDLDHEGLRTRLESARDATR